MNLTNEEANELVEAYRDYATGAGTWNKFSTLCKLYEFKPRSTGRLIAGYDVWAARRRQENAQRRAERKAARQAGLQLAA